MQVQKDQKNLPLLKIGIFSRLELKMSPSKTAAAYSEQRLSQMYRTSPMPEEQCEAYVLLICNGPSSEGADGSLRLDAVQHERTLPTIKHVGEVAKTHYLRHAVARGFDDAIFVDRQGLICEATIWNVALWDGEAVVWPEADHLPGVTMGILKRRLSDHGVPQREAVIALDDVRRYRGAVVMNSWTPGVAVERIASVAIPPSEPFMKLLRHAYASEPAVRV